MDAGNLVSLVVAHGYPALALIVGLESMGLPLPGETALITAAIYAGSTHTLEIGPIIATAAAGAIVGDSAGFWMGRWIGDTLLLRYRSRIRLTPQRLAIGRQMFARHGGAVVFFGRFVSLLRTLAAILAGVNHMPWRRFLAFNAAGGFAWATSVGLGAYLLGQRIERLQEGVGLVGLIATIGAIAGVWVFVKRYESRWLTRVGTPTEPLPPHEAALRHADRL
jgi:membrane protein DedA with SNARE-associated domain